MARADFRLIAVAAGCWGATLLAIAFPPLLPLLFILGLLAIGASLRRGGHRATNAILRIVGAALLCCQGVALHLPLRYPEALEDSSSDRQLTVVAERVGIEGESVVWGHIHAVNDVAVWPTPVMVLGPELTQRIIPGQQLDISGTPRPVRGLDSRAWLVRADTLEPRGSPPHLMAQADQLRVEFSRRSSALGGDGGALLPGLALGDTSQVSQSLEYDMRRAALAHLVAVSGANCAIVVALVVALVALLGGGVWWRLGAGGLALVAFVILVTPEPSVIRAAVMATAALLAGALGRPSLGLHLLALTVWVLLMWDPWCSVEISFALSVAATAGIIAGLRPLSNFLARFLPGPLALLLALPLAAQLAVSPLLLLLKPTLATYGVVANVLAAPLAPLVSVTGLAGSIIGPLIPRAGDAIVWLGWWPASGIAAIARAVAAMPLAEIPWVGGVSGFFVQLTLSIGIWLIASGRARRWGVAAMVASVSVVASQTLVPDALARASIPRDWWVAQCDVGQGDSLLVNSSGGIIAIDTGDDEEALRRCLRLMNINTVRVLILSHFDRDHVAQSLVFRARTEEVWSPAPENAEDRRRIQDLVDQGARHRQVHEGHQVQLGDTEIRVIWPSQKPLAEPGNDSSVVVHITTWHPDAPATSLLALGDLGEAPQLMLRGRLGESAVDVVKVSHHGSADQAAALYQQISAPVGLIGVGTENTYGHPAPTTLAMLEEAGTFVYRSDRDGTVVIEAHPDGLRVWRGGAR